MFDVHQSVSADVSKKSNAGFTAAPEKVGRANKRSGTCFEMPRQRVEFVTSLTLALGNLILESCSGVTPESG